MQLYAPQTRIEGRWRDAVVIFIGLWLALLGAFAWWTDYLLYTIPDFVDEWTSEEKQKSVQSLIERAQAEGVVEPTQEQKMLLLFTP